MTSVPKIIDAQSEPVSRGSCSVPGSSANMQSVPLKIDASQMQQMLQGMVSQQMQTGPVGPAPRIAGVQVDPGVDRINPSIHMKAISEEMEKLYARFDRLKKLAAELHGRQLDTPLPDHVRLKNIVINFSLIKDGNEEEHSAEIQTIASIGDITSLLSTEFGVIILALSDQSRRIQELAEKTSERCNSALSEWEKNNKDKKIVRTGDNNVSAEDENNQQPDTPVTLEAS